MLDAKFVLENLESVQNRLAARGPRISLEEFVRVSREKKGVLKIAEDLRARKNKVSEEVSRLKKEGKDASSLIADMRKVGDEIAGLDEKLKAFEEELKTTLLNIPNIPHESVPVGRGAEENKEVRRFGTRPEFGFKPQAHWDIGEKLGILDFARAAKIT
ncbi:MAG: serine--tRNA ligase, partial [Candidatus Aminicenantes bacterium]|nr:serine--tRNA ligase [Candidatus Aminicenantes bacterium]